MGFIHHSKPSIPFFISLVLRPRKRRRRNRSIRLLLSRNPSHNFVWPIRIFTVIFAHFLTPKRLIFISRRQPFISMDMSKKHQIHIILVKKLFKTSSDHQIIFHTIIIMPFHRRLPHQKSFFKYKFRLSLRKNSSPVR